MNYQYFLKTNGIDLWAETHNFLTTKEGSMNKNAHWEVK